jgi:hypothetical protein
MLAVLRFNQFDLNKQQKLRKSKSHAAHRMCLPPCASMNLVRPELVTESVTIVDPGVSRSVTAAMSAISLFLLMARLQKISRNTER